LRSLSEALVKRWHPEAASEWLEREGLQQKVSAPFKLTNAQLGTRGRTSVLPC
jgi:hypothetical protein